MAIRVGVNSFGRVGRNFFRAVDAQQAAGTTDIEIVAVNDLTDNKTLAHLLKYDSVLGRRPHDVSVDGEDLVIGERRIKAWSIADGPATLPWGDLGVDVVIESTGRYNAAEQARGHLYGGAKKVVVSATSRGADLTVVMGFLTYTEDPIVSSDIVTDPSSCIFDSGLTKVTGDLVKIVGCYDNE